MRIVFRPLRPADWPGERDPAPEMARFSAEWGDTLDLLEREVRALQRRPRHDVAEVVLQVDAPESAMRLDGGIRSNAVVNDHAVIVSFDSKHGPLRYACDRYTHASTWQSGRGSVRTPGWKANVRAIALGLEALRKVDRYGIARDGQQYRGWNELGAGTPMPAGDAMTVEQAWQFLIDHAPGDHHPDDTARDLYRRAARAHHPDLGGDPDTFRRLTIARDLCQEHDL